jgi:hypothetical protein
MRVAELEDKLSKVHITDEEMKAYHKVNSLIGGQTPAETAPAATAGLTPQVCVISRAISRSISPRSISPISRGIGECYECSCGPCGQAGGGGFTGGFGGLGQ